MSEFFEALTSHYFLQNALLGGILASVACGVVGSYVVVKRISYLAAGISHAILGGMGIAYFFGKSPMSGALVASVIFALILGWVSLRWKQQEDTIIGALWSMGMAVGILFLSKTPGYHMDLMSYLFGNILMISRDDLYLIGGLDLAILVTVGLFYKQLLAVAFDEEFAKLRGISVEWFYILFLILIGFTVVIMIRIVGLILVIALLTIPPAIANHYIRSLNHMMILAVILGVFFTCSGLALSYEPDLPSGPMIIVLSGSVFIVSVLAQNAFRKKRF
jgi:zinc transport system permease protein